MALRPLIFSDYAPDLDPITPGAVQDCGGMMPSDRGFRTLPGLERVAGLPSACFGMIAAPLLGTILTAGATASGLFAYSNGVFVPQVTGLSNQTNRWRFAPYGQDLIAVNGVDPAYYYRLSNGNFQLMPGSPPVAALVATTDYAVILVPPNSQTLYSNLSDTAPWTPNAAAEVYQYNLANIAGNITAVTRKRAYLTVYRANAIQSASFVGGLDGWDFGNPGTISLTVGAAGAECVVNIGDLDYIWGPDDFYTFDGYNLNAIPNHLKETVFRDLNQQYAANIAGRYDVQRDLVFWHYPSRTTAWGLAGNLDSYVVLYRRTGKWGFGRLNIELPMQAVMPDPDLSSKATTPNSGIVLPDHNLYLYDDDVPLAPTSGAFLTSNDFGDRQFVYQTRRVMPGFTTAPVSSKAGEPAARLTPLTQMQPGTTPVAGDAEVLSDDGWFNVMASARLMRFKLEMYGTAEVTQGIVDINPTGET